MITLILYWNREIISAYETQHTLTCRHPVQKEYIALAITDQEMMMIVFVLLYSHELYIDSIVENPPHISAREWIAPFQRRVAQVSRKWNRLLSRRVLKIKA